MKDIFKSGVNKISFKSQGVNLVGLLFAPQNFDNKKKYKTIVFSGPLLQVKEQMGKLYGEEFANNGFVFLSFDHIGHGESEGEIRNAENGFWKMEGIRDATSYLLTLDFVDKDHLYGLGGCASGGYLPLVAVTDKRFKAIATISGMMNNLASYFGTKEMSDMTIMGIKAANAARQRMYENGKHEQIDIMGYDGLTPEQIEEQFPDDTARKEGYYYYMTDLGRTKNYSHMTHATVLEYAPLCDAVAFAEYLFMPWIGVVGSKAVTAPLTENFYKRAKSPKKLVKIKDATHVDLYHVKENITEATNAIIKFWEEQA